MDDKPILDVDVAREEAKSRLSKRASPALDELNALLADPAKRPGFELDHLPLGHSMGTTLAERLGLVVPGTIVGVGASRAGAGKTMWVQQLANGRALRSASNEAKGSGHLTPVLWASEMDNGLLLARTLAHSVSLEKQAPPGVCAAMFRRGYRFRAPGVTEATVDEAQAIARKLTATGSMLRSALQDHSYNLNVGGGTSPSELKTDVIEAVEALRAQWPEREVWPVLVLDPLQRFALAGDDELAGVNALCDMLEGIARPSAGAAKCIVLFTSDTNKEAAKRPRGRGAQAGAECPYCRNPVQPVGAGVYRSSYRLQHLADVMLALVPSMDAQDERTGFAHVVITKNREGAFGRQCYRWLPESGQYLPIEGPADAVRHAPP